MLLAANLVAVSVKTSQGRSPQFSEANRCGCDWTSLGVFAVRPHRPCRTIHSYACLGDCDCRCRCAFRFSEILLLAELARVCKFKLLTIAIGRSFIFLQASGSVSPVPGTTHGGALAHAAATSVQVWRYHSPGLIDPAPPGCQSLVRSPPQCVAGFFVAPRLGRLMNARRMNLGAISHFFDTRGGPN